MRFLNSNLSIKNYAVKTVLVAVLFGSLPLALFGQSQKEKASQIWSVKIKGNKTFSDGEIKDQIFSEGYSFMDKLKFWNRSAHKLDKIEVKKDVIRIRNFYNDRGFANADVHYQIEEKKKEWKKKVIFIITEKAPVRIKKLTFDFTGKDEDRKAVRENSDFKKAKRKSAFQVGKRYAPFKKAEVVGNYTEVLKNMGFAYADVSLKAKVDTARLAADITIDADLGPIAYIDSISVKGDSTVTDRYVIRESGLKKGGKYSLTSLREAQWQIYNHHLFQFVTIDIPEQPEDSTLDLAIHVRENALRTVEASVGFGTRDLLRGQVGWTHRNVFGLAHKFSVTGRASFITQSLSFDYLFPYVFNPKSSFVVSPLIVHLLEPGYELLSYGITNSFIYRYSRSLTGTVSYKYTRNDERSPQSGVQLPDTSQNYNISSLQFSGYYNQEFESRGRKGWMVQPFIELSGFLGKATYKYQKISLDVRRYTPLSNTTTLVTRVQGGRIFSAGVDSLPHDIRDYLGGTSSVRGWYRHQLGPKRPLFKSSSTPDSTAFSRYVPTGGRTFFAFNLEIRQGIDKFINGFGVAAFLDGGQLWRRGVDFSKRSLQFGAGGGLRYSSPIGNVRLYIGYKLNPTDQDLNIYRGRNHGNFWDRIAIHLSLGRSL